MSELLIASLAGALLGAITGGIASYLLNAAFKKSHIKNLEEQAKALKEIAQIQQKQLQLMNDQFQDQKKQQEFNRLVDAGKIIWGALYKFKDD